MKRRAFTARDLLAAVDVDTEARSSGCTPNLIRFDENKGYLDFVTRCPNSKNSWYQRVRFEDFDVLLDLLEQEGLDEVEEELPEEEDQLLEDIVEEQVDYERPQETQELGASLSRKSIEWQEVKRDIPEILNSDIRVACNCPSYLFQFSYVVDQLDAGETSLGRYQNAPTPENRPPNERNPSLEGIICKHLVAVLKRFF